MEEKIAQLSRQVQMLTVLFFVLMLGFLFLVYKSYALNELLVTRNLIIKDEEGRTRIHMGFNDFNKPDRLRQDRINGISMLDTNGVDRIHIGQDGKLQVGGELYDRDVKGWSILFNEPSGDERGGFGFTDTDNSMGLGMDYPGAKGGEAIYLYAGPGLSFMTMNADIPSNSGVRDRIVLWQETEKDLSLFKLGDSKDSERILLRSEAGTPVLNVTDLDGNKKQLKIEN
jgi:hypothetical protein